MVRSFRWNEKSRRVKYFIIDRMRPLATTHAVRAVVQQAKALLSTLSRELGLTRRQCRNGVSRRWLRIRRLGRRPLIPCPLLKPRRRRPSHSAVTHYCRSTIASPVCRTSRALAYPPVLQSAPRLAYSIWISSRFKLSKAISTGPTTSIARATSQLLSWSTRLTGERLGNPPVGRIQQSDQQFGADWATKYTPDNVPSPVPPQLCVT